MVTQTPITIEAYLDLIERHPDQHFELTADGAVIEVSLKKLHGIIQLELAYIFRVYMASDNLPGFEAMTEVLHNLPGFPCQPDLSINAISDEQIPTTAPLLAVEIKSDGNTLKDLRAKAQKYIAAGTKMVWLVLPEKQIIEIYQPDADDQLLTIHDTIDGGAVLPGFTLAVRDLFPA